MTQERENIDVVDYNRQAWDQQVDQGSQWTLPVSTEQIEKARNGIVHFVLTPTKIVPDEWLHPLPGKDVLCLAGAGGQQAPLLAAAGAKVSVLDNSPKQLEQDQVVAKREGLEIKSVLGVMSDLSAFEDESFDLIVHPCSNSFAPDVLPVWREAFRVIRPGGNLISGISNPFQYIFDYAEYEKGNLVVRHKIPVSEADDYDEEMKQRMIARGEPFSFSHTLEDQIGGQIAAGFSITGFFEDNWAESENDLLAPYIDSFIATRATKPPL